MNRDRLRIGFVLLVVPVALAAVTPIRALSPAEIAERATPSVVLIQVEDGVGSGFVAAGGGRIVTNLHVLFGASEATVVLHDGREFDDVEIMAVDQQHDLALLRIGARDLEPLKLGKSSRVRAGEHVVAIGHPLGLGNTVSDGLVSAVREFEPGQSFLQISAPISPGSSGGPLFNDRGDVIGVATLIVASGQNLNFAIPIDTVKPLLSAQEGVPLREYASTAWRTRNIPDHPMTLLNSCPPAKLRSIVRRIERAISIGAPLYNDGNHEACFRIYASVALETQEDRECAGPRRALLDGVDNAEGIEGWSDKAWAMRDAFDGLLSLAWRFETELAASEPPSAEPPEREVPRHPAGFLDGCADADLAVTREGLTAAIANGGPLCEEDQAEACYRIYEGAAREIGRKVPGCSPATGALKDALAAVAAETDPARKARALRDVFDGLLEAIAGRFAADDD